MKKIQSFLEIQFFGVCTYLGEKMGISISKIRLFFIYLSFITFGSPVIVYLMMAFLLDIRKFFRKKEDLTGDF